MQVQQEALQRAIKLLSAAGCKFAIVTADGKQHGELQIAAPEPERKRRVTKFPRGTLKSYYEPLVENVKPGSCAVIPYGQFSADDDTKSALRAAIASHCSAKWGNGTYITHMNEAGVELLRMD